MVEHERQFLSLDEFRQIRSFHRHLTQVIRGACLVRSSGSDMRGLTKLAATPRAADIARDPGKPRAILLRAFRPSSAAPGRSARRLRQVLRDAEIPRQIRAPAHQPRALGTERSFQPERVCFILYSAYRA